MEGLWNALSAIDWNSLLSAAIGGGFALAGVYFAAARDRINRQQEESYRFQRDTLMQLQDAIQTHVRAVQQIEFWRERPARMVQTRRDALGDLYGTPQGDALMPPPTPMDRVQHMQDLTPHASSWHESRWQIEKIVERVDDDEIRANTKRLIDAARTVIEEPAIDNVNAINATLNEEIGQVIRRGALLPAKKTAIARVRQRFQASRDTRTARQDRAIEA